MKQFNQWMKARTVIEDVEEQKRLQHDATPHDLVQFPLSQDVVFKHGTSVHSHPGNAWYRDLLQSHLEKYSRGETSIQVVLSLLVDDVEQMGGRFLEWSSRHNCWKVMHDPSQIRTKVYTTCNYLDKQHQARRKLQVNSSNTSIFAEQDGRKRQRTGDRMESECCSDGCG